LSSLEDLLLSSNSLVGSLPSQLGGLTALQVLDVGSNSIAGSIPSQLGSLTNLNTLDLSSNDIAGSLPSSLGSMSSLTSLDVSGNSLTGSVPSSLCNVPLDTFVLGRTYGGDSSNADMSCYSGCLSSIGTSSFGAMYACSDGEGVLCLSVSVAFVFNGPIYILAA